MATAAEASPWWLPQAATEAAETANRQILVMDGVAIALFAVVLVILAVVLLRYRARQHPDPSPTQQHAVLETLWVLVPAAVVLVVAAVTLPGLYAEAAPQKVDETIKVVAHQDYWTYSFSRDGGFRFDSVQNDEQTAREREEPPLLSVDYPLYVPVGKTIALEITAADAARVFAVPELGLRVEAVPGRVKRVVFTPTKPGTYYAMSVGTRSLAPVVIKVVDEIQYLEWVAHARLLFSDASTVRFAGRARSA